MFLHFGVNTYADLEWSDGTLDPAIFNPVHLDCSQWVAVAKEMGARYMVLTAKHHDGFCLWQTDTTGYSVKSSPWKGGKGDVVREFVDACKNAGMAHGLYLSPWDRHEPCYKDKDAYDKFYEKQLTELCTWYDTEYTELWFDGAGSHGREYDWKNIIGVCKRHQPQAVIFNMGEPDIRWAGNEAGLAPYPLWNVIPRDQYGGLKEGKPGYFWLPAECDKPVRYQTWFYNTKNEMCINSQEELVKVYLWSVGRGANLLLNLAPGRDGLIPAVDRNAARELGSAVETLFSFPLAAMAPDGGDCTSVELAVSEGAPVPVNYVEIEEDIAFGQRVRSYTIQGRAGNDEWKTITAGTSIGHKKIDIFKPVKVNTLRFVVNDAFAPPVIKTFSAYHHGDMDRYREYIEEDYI